MYRSLIFVISVFFQASVSVSTIPGFVELCLLTSVDGNAGRLADGRSGFGIALSGFLLVVLFKCLSAEVGVFVTEEPFRVSFYLFLQSLTPLCWDLPNFSLTAHLIW